MERKANAFPAKSFFVNMLTRDIDLSDAILDLLDNCVDGVLRTKWNEGVPSNIERPYEGYHAEISINENYFTIKDNCGGIPYSIAEDYAFRMGRTSTVDADIPTVGIYGIGMKRAMFKMGKESRVISRTENGSFKVEITPEWLESDEEWKLPISTLEQEPVSEFGTTIEVTQLYSNISKRFSFDDFVNDLKGLVARQYSFIISKGFRIKINEQAIQPVSITLLLESSFDNEVLSPYVYQGKFDDVDVLIEVGIYRPTPSEDELDKEMTIRRSSDESGWTIICNDRVVVYKDKSMLTGWGEANVPNFHNQFIGITGVVIFRSNNVSKLPLTTTKRGIDASSEIYLHVKNYMRQGMKLFTDYTNKWKKETEKERQIAEKASSINVLSLPTKIPAEKWKTVRNNYPEKDINYEEKHFVPNLPKPKQQVTARQIRFTREINEIKRVSEFLFEDPDATPSDVGNACFEEILRRIEE